MKLKWVLSDTSRHGKRRFYFRRPGAPMIRLPDDPDAPEFLAAYQAALNGTPPEPARPAPPPVVGNTSLRWLVGRYEASADFQRLDARTQHVRRLVLASVLEEHGDKSFARLQPEHVRVLRDEKVKTPEAANARVKALRQVYKFAKEYKHHDQNPAMEVPYFSGSAEGFHAWDLDEIEQFETRHPVGTKARLALALLLYTGQRRSDVVGMGKQHIRVYGGREALHVKQFKGRKKKQIVVDIPVVKPLREIIDASPCGDLTFLVTQFRKPFTAAGFSNWFRERCDEAGLPQCSAHGLRKAAAMRLAEMGCTVHEIMSITGHTTLKEVQRYIEAVDKKRLAAAAAEKMFKADE